MTVPTFRLGQLVTSKAGRDKGKAFIIIGIEGDRYVRLADGARRSAKQPKIKNIRHLQAYDRVDQELALQLESGRQPSDEVVRAALATLLAGWEMDDYAGDRDGERPG